MGKNKYSKFGGQKAGVGMFALLDRILVVQHMMVDCGTTPMQTVPSPAWN